jgi:hypothetical protein
MWGRGYSRFKAFGKRQKAKTATMSQHIAYSLRRRRRERERERERRRRRRRGTKDMQLENEKEAAIESILTRCCYCTTSSTYRVFHKSLHTDKRGCISAQLSVGQMIFS